MICLPLTLLIKGMVQDGDERGGFIILRLNPKASCRICLNNIHIFNFGNFLVIPRQHAGSGIILTEIKVASVQAKRLGLFDELDVVLVDFTFPLGMHRLNRVAHSRQGMVNLENWIVVRRYGHIAIWQAGTRHMVEDVGQ